MDGVRASTKQTLTRPGRYAGRTRWPRGKGWPRWTRAGHGWPWRICHGWSWWSRGTLEAHVVVVAVGHEPDEAWLVGGDVHVDPVVEA